MHLREEGAYMAYHFQDTQLRVFRKYAKEERNQNLLFQTRFIILEHILPTTESMINILHENGAEIHTVVAKPYSIDEKVLDRLKANNFCIVKDSYENYESTNILQEILNDAVKKSEKDKKSIIIVDVGGYFAKPIIELQKVNKNCTTYIAGIIEDTTFGHNRYLEAVKKIRVPVFSVARSSLKEIEARFVGQDAVMAMETLLRELGILMSGRHALVIGYGMIGKNVALALKNSHLVVSVYDQYDFRNLAAYIDGYNIHKKRELIKNADIIFFATGNPSGALTYEEIEECKDCAILVSAGSKNTEFAFKELKAQKTKEVELSKHLTEYSLPNGHRIVVAKNGTAVNFLLPSLSVEVLDLVFSEILLCALLLLRERAGDPKKIKYKPGTIHETESKHRATISKDWLRLVNN